MSLPEGGGTEHSDSPCGLAQHGVGCVGRGIGFDREQRTDRRERRLRALLQLGLDERHRASVPERLDHRIVLQRRLDDRLSPSTRCGGEG
jgi:hypothetical protein